MNAGQGDASPLQPSDGARLCAWCRSELEATARADSVFCGKRCRQAAWRLRGRRVRDASCSERRIRVAYADPPYPGLAARYYRKEETFAGEVDHAELVARLSRDYPDGWALSTSREALRDVLPLCPPSAHLCPWVKPIGACPATLGLHTTWEALIVVGGRQRQPGVRDWLRAMPARGWGTLPGRKPVAFAAWLFDCLGLEPGDTLDDLYPGTGAIGRAWTEASRILEERHLRRVGQVLSDSAESSATAGAGRHVAEDVPGDASPAAAADDGSRRVA